MTKNTQYRLFSIAIFGVLFLIIFDYQKYIYLFLLLSFLYFYYFIEYKNEITVKIFSYISIPIFFISKYIFAINEDYNNFWVNQSQRSYSGYERFWDIQQFYFGLVCNNLKKINQEFNYVYLFGSNTKSCPFDIGWGPLANNLSINLDIWNATLITGFVALLGLLILHLISLNYSNDLFITSIIFLSPPVNFLFERMNIDLLIFILMFYIFKNFERNNLFKSLLIFIIILFKVHPIGLIPGILIFASIKKDKKIFYINFVIGVLASYIILFLTNSTGSITSKVYPDDFGRSFGLLNNFEILTFYNQKLGTKYLIVSLVVYLCILVFVLLRIKKNFSSSKIEYFDYLMTSLFSWFIFVSIFENFDYRLGFIILLASKFDLNNKLYLFFFLFVFLSPLNTYGIENLVSYNVLIYFIKNFLFHSILLIMILNLLKLEMLNIFRK